MRDRFTALQNAADSGDQISRWSELGDDLQPTRKNGDRDGRAAEEEHPHVNRLDQDHRFLGRIHHCGDDQSDRTHRERADADENEEGKKIWRHVHAVKSIGQKERNDDARQIKNETGDHRRHQQRHRCYRCHFVAAKHVRFALLHRAHPGAKKSVSENSNRRHHGHDQQHDGALFRIVHLPEGEKENEREEIIENQDRLVPEGQLQIDDKEGVEGFHCSLVAQFFSGQLDENVLERRPG